MQFSAGKMQFSTDRCASVRIFLEVSRPWRDVRLNERFNWSMGGRFIMTINWKTRMQHVEEELLLFLLLSYMKMPLQACTHGAFNAQKKKHEIELSCSSFRFHDVYDAKRFNLIL